MRPSTRCRGGDADATDVPAAVLGGTGQGRTGPGQAGRRATLGGERDQAARGERTAVGSGRAQAARGERTAVGSGRAQAARGGRTAVGSGRAQAARGERTAAGGDRDQAAGRGRTALGRRRPAAGCGRAAVGSQRNARDRAARPRRTAMARQRSPRQRRLYLLSERLCSKHGQPTRDHRQPDQAARNLHRPDQQGWLERVPGRAVQVPALCLTGLPVVPAGADRMPATRP